MKDMHTHLPRYPCRIQSHPVNVVVGWLVWLDKTLPQPTNGESMMEILPNSFDFCLFFYDTNVILIKLREKIACAWSLNIDFLFITYIRQVILTCYKK
jgi:hypothetical protein